MADFIALICGNRNLNSIVLFPYLSASQNGEIMPVVQSIGTDRRVKEARALTDKYCFPEALAVYEKLTRDYPNVAQM
jgi:hypothetical protein